MNSCVEEIFHKVADLSTEERARYFAENDVEAHIRREVEALVAFDSRPTGPLNTDIGQAALETLARLEPADKLCGPYRVGTLLGRGGMGTVHLADRVDGEVSQQVAVKLLRPGGDDPELRRRFLSERQILAGLSHPNIARLLDAGHREDGQPYLVMEYVEGQTIDVYTRGLGIREKIALFIKVCAAVGYLHRNLVVHRDLKPGNILVTREGEPKLLDFGIAKMLAISTDATATIVRMLTPDYASPEQILGDPITTASDIYSLGAVLYELLTGTTPHKSGGAAKAIALAISMGKITPPSKLAPAVKGDLEIILMKALRAEPQERYTAVEQFAEDLENYLQSRPIRARKGDSWYRMQKFLRRHWLQAAFGALTVGGLSAGLLVANYERTVAQRRFVQVRQLANKLFDIDVEVRQTPGTTKARELIVGTSLDYLRRMAAEVHGDPELELEVGNAYMRVARVQGVPISGNLGQVHQAEQNLLIAESFINSVLASQPANRIALLRSAQVAHDRMLIARQNSHPQDALAFARKSAASLEKFQAEKSDFPERVAILNTYLNVADQHMLGEQYDEAMRLCRRGTAIAQTLESPPYAGAMLWIPTEVFRRRGELDQALHEIRESVSKLDYRPEDASEPRVMNFALSLIKEGKVLGEDGGISLGRSQEAAVVFQRALKLADDYAHRDPRDQNSRGALAVSGLDLARILRHSDARQSLETFDHVLQHVAEIQNNSSFRRFEVSALAGSTEPLLRLGRPAEARQRLDVAFERLSQVKLYPAERIELGSEADEALSARAEYEAAQGRKTRALEIYSELLRKVMSSEPKPEIRLRDAVDLSRLYTAIDGYDHASGMNVRRLKLWRSWNSKLPNNAFVLRQLKDANASVQ